MTIKEFRALDIRYRTIDPSVCEAVIPDLLASEEQLTAVEEALGVRLPAQYRSFLREFGGGCFRHAEIYSADPNSLRKNYLPHQADSIIPDEFIPFSDDGYGGYYVLQAIDGQAQDAVYYLDGDTWEISDQKRDFLECVAHLAYRGAFTTSKQ